MIRPAGYYNVKAGSLKNFIAFLYERYNGDFNRMLQAPLKTLRDELLDVKGIGPETADSILLYAAGKPIFVVDAYTKRVFTRHKLIPEGCGYEEIQSFFMKNLPRSGKLYNEFHALIVMLAKTFCRKKPDCRICPLKEG